MAAAPAEARAPATTDESQFVRGIGPLAAVSLVVGSMIGSGIFIVSAETSRQVSALGPAGLLLAWGITGAITVAGALAYVELAAMMPNAGGQYVFLRDGLAPSAGFLYGWTLFMVVQSGTIAAVAVAFGRFLGVLVPSLTPAVFLKLGSFPMPASGTVELGLSPQRVVAILMVWVLTAVNIRGVRLGAAIQSSFTLAKVGALSALILLGLTISRRPDVADMNFASFWGTGPWNLAVLPVLGAAMVGPLFSNDAWNNVTFAGAEVRDARRNLPLALALGTVLVSLLYLSANLAYLSVLPFQGDPNGAGVLARGIQHAAQDRVGTAAMEVMLGPVGAVVMAVAILVSTFGCNNGLILAGARVYYAMARDRLFFRSAGELHPTFRTPVVGLVAQALWTTILCVSGTYSDLLKYVVFAALLFYLLTAVALFRLRRLRPDVPRPIKAVGYPVLPALYIAATAFVLVVLLLDPKQRLYSVLGLLVVLLGVPVYGIWRRAAA